MARAFDFKKTLGVCWSKRDKKWRIHSSERQDELHLKDLLRSEDFMAFSSELEKRGYDMNSFRMSVRKK